MINTNNDNHKPHMLPNGLPAFYSPNQISYAPEFNNLAPAQINEVFKELKSNFYNGLTLGINYRKSQLQNLKKGLLELHQEICDHVYKDFKSPKDYLLDLYPAIKELNYALENIDKWAKDEYVEKPLPFILDKVFIKKEPLGVVLVISPWNYPLQLAIIPVIGAISSGNCAVLKPSEKVPYTNMALRKLFKYLDHKCYRIVECEVEHIDQMLDIKWDFIFYTGNGKIAKRVLSKAATNIVPTCLELGGKNPVLVDKSADYKISAKRILWGKMLNSGQVCLCPDYVICLNEIKQTVIEALVKELEKTYTNQILEDRTKIITKEQTKRLCSLIENINNGDHIVYGGGYDIENRTIDPTIVSIHDPYNSQFMEDELFCPILLVVGMDTMKDIIDFVAKSRDKKLIDQYLSRISSGTVAINDTILQHQVHTMPFGGVGYSGYGAYMGKYSFDLFSNKKSILQKGFSEIVNYARYEPINNEIAYPLFFPDMFKPFNDTNRFKRLLNRYISRIRWYMFMAYYLLKCLKGDFNKKFK